MANTIELATKCVTMLDEVYKQSSKTMVLDSGSDIVTMTNDTGEFKIPKYDMDGLGDYSHTERYAAGDVKLEWETKKPNYDRGRKFAVDAMDNEESIALAFGLLSSEFMRTKVVPEMDAMRFAQYASTTGIQKKAETFATVTDITNAIMTANIALDEAEVTETGRYLFVTPTLLQMINAMDTYKSKAMMERFASIMTVPQSRFYTAIDTLDGKSSNEKAGGFKKATGASDINFMIVDKAAVLQVQKHVVSKIIAPEVNQSMDAWAFYYRTYGLTDVLDNHAKGIYCSYKTT